MKKLENKVCIITGASSGIGKAVAQRFAEEGAKLAICSRTKSKLDAVAKLCEETGAEVLAVQCDVGENDQLVHFMNQVQEKYGHIDVLVNNAQAADVMIPFIDTTMENLQKSLKTGFFATWTLMQLCFPLMKQNGGSIINFGSDSTNGLPGFSTYASIKSAISCLGRVVANEWGEYNIRVNTICPLCLTDTAKESYPKEVQDLIIKSNIEHSPLKRVGDAKEDIAPAVLFLASDDSRWITGQEIHVEGGSDIHN